MGHNKYGIALVAGVLLVAGGLAACTDTPEPNKQKAQDQGPVEPVDAFNKVGEPHRSQTDIGNDTDNLSTDIERLQDAHSQYQHDKAQEAAEQQRRQAECRKAKDSDKVAIEDGSENPSVYCQDAPQQ